MRVSGHIKNGPTEPVNYHYFVAFNPSVELFPTSDGPKPVVEPPYGNGFVSGGVTHFVTYDNTLSAPYGVFKFVSQDLLASVQTGIPITYTAPGENGTTISFELDLSQITPNGVSPGDLQSVQMNFLTQDKPPEIPQNKIWDALGDSRSLSSINDYIRIPLNVSTTYTSDTFGGGDTEPEGDVSDPDLDIVYWSVEVRRP